MAVNIGCIGCGNMGSAILKGLSETLNKDCFKLFCFDASYEKMDSLAAFGITAVSSISELANTADFIICAVKPQHMEEVLSFMQSHMNENKTAISIAAGVSLARIRAILGQKCGIIRCMPTTTARVQKGVFAFCYDALNPDNSALNAVMEIFGKIGICIKLDEKRFNDYSALIGAGPAYIFQFLQGLCQAGVTLGFSYDMSRQMLVELADGCAELAKAENSKHLMQLRDEVCSPGGLTIAGINVLDSAGISGLLTEAVLRARQRGLEMENP